MPISSSASRDLTALQALHLHLKGLSETRWNCRAVSLERLMEPGVLPAAVETLEYVASTTSDGKARGTEVGLIATITKYEFIVSLCTLAPNLIVLNEVSEHLQKVKIDLLEEIGRAHV